MVCPTPPQKSQTLRIGTGDFGAGIGLDASGNSYVTGQFEGSATFGAGEANETTLRSAGGSDIFVAKYGAGSPTSVDEPSVLIDDFKLAQNYPNPFNPQTTIQYGLPHAAFIRLVIYDTMGRRVQVLVEGLRSPGWHEVVFETSDLPSGAYFYRLEAGSFQGTSQMLLVK